MGPCSNTDAAGAASCDAWDGTKLSHGAQQNVVRLDSRYEIRWMRGGTYDSQSRRDVSADTRVQGDKQERL